MRSNAKFPRLGNHRWIWIYPNTHVGTQSQCQSWKKWEDSSIYLEILPVVICPLLSKVCCSASPVYYKEGRGSLAISLQSKSLDIPELLHVGGEGLFVNKATGITCDKLQTIDGITDKSATSLFRKHFPWRSWRPCMGLFLTVWRNLPTTLSSASL